MKERPILFQGAMVRALMAGSKTQTRRIIKHNGASGFSAEFQKTQAFQDRLTPLCPYGQPGDRLWVRETWTEDPEDDGTWAYTQYMGCKGSPLSDIPVRFRRPEHCIFRADWNGVDLVWRSSIHMPRWASRILLEIVSVRVERLNEISEADCWAEGIDACDGMLDDMEIINLAKQMGRRFEDTAPSYAALWESINGAGSWAANPFVWVVEFKRIQPQEQSC